MCRRLEAAERGAAKAVSVEPDDDGVCWPCWEWPGGGLDGLLPMSGEGELLLWDEIRGGGISELLQKRDKRIPGGGGDGRAVVGQAAATASGRSGRGRGGWVDREMVGEVGRRGGGVVGW